MLSILYTHRFLGAASSRSFDFGHLVHSLATSFLASSTQVVCTKNYHFLEGQEEIQYFGIYLERLISAFKNHKRIHGSSMVEPCCATLKIKSVMVI